jgi:hypothetical protein
MRNEKFDMQQINARQENQISDQRLRIEDLERKISQNQQNEERQLS